MNAVAFHSALVASGVSGAENSPAKRNPVPAARPTAPSAPRDGGSVAAGSDGDRRRPVDPRLEQLGAACELLPTACVAVTVSGRIVTANTAFTRWLQLEPGRLGENTLQQFLPPFEAGRVAAHLELCLGVPGGLTMETTLRVGPERLVPVLLTSRMRELKGEAFAIVAITNLEPMRSARGGSRELQQDHLLLTEALSHDLRAPLVTLRAFTRILRDDCPRALGPGERDIIERIERSARRVDTILQQLLAYVSLRREEPGLRRIETEQVALGVAAQWRELAAQRRAEITLVRPMPPVRACPRLLADALAHLVGNALDFGSPERQTHIRISCEERQGAVTIHVADNGVGIDPAFTERIFQPGERMLPHPDGPGAGLGLAIVRRAVECMHGRIWVESQRDHGSCFHILLPRA